MHQRREGGPGSPKSRRGEGGGLASPERRRSEGGFTLIELMIVMVLIAILAGMGLAVYGNSVKTAKEATLRQDLTLFREAIDKYYADKNKYPPSLDALVEDRYIRAVVPDPITGSRDTWQTITADPEPGNPSAEPGIYDVKSGAPGTGLDGTPYSEW
jgi:general secretion pathway protein G